MIDLQHCQALDAADELASFKERFELPASTIYLDGNSLGAKPKGALEHAAKVIEEEWGNGLIGSWNTAGWWNLPTQLGDKLAAVVGADSGELIVTDTTSLNVFKALAAAVSLQREAHPERRLIIAERESFPTDLYMIQGFIKSFGEGYSLALIDEPEDLATIGADDIAVVILSHANYRSGYLHDMQATNQLLHDRGALVIWDLCHSAGAVPISLKADNSDFAIGCTYKYLNGGPGSPAFLWANPRHLLKADQPLSGWWGHAKPFDMAQNYAPANNIRRYLCGTQSIVSLSLIRCGLDMFAEVSMQQLRRKSLALTDLFIALVEQECGDHGLRLVTPRNHHYRGSHVSLRHAEGYAIVQALIARGVIGDYREPEVMRFGVTPLYLSHEDIWNAVQQLKQVLDSREWDQARFQARSEVT